MSVKSLAYLQKLVNIFKKQNKAKTTFKKSLEMVLIAHIQ